MLAGLRPSAGYATEVAEIDPGAGRHRGVLRAYGVDLAESANCVVIIGKRGGRRPFAACVVLATTLADVNGLARRQLDQAKATFAPMDEAVAETGMEYGGITPVGLPAAGPILVTRGAPRPR